MSTINYLGKTVSDPSLMIAARETFGVVASSIGVAGEAGGRFFPLFGILAAPFYFPHAVKFTKMHFRDMRTELGEGRHANAFYSFGMGLDSLGMVIIDTAKPVIGVARLSGLAAKSVALGAVCSVAVPIIVTLFGVVGVAINSWACVRTHRQLKNFQATNLEQYLKGSSRRDEILDEILKDADRAAELTKSELRRRLCCKVFMVFLSAASIAAGILFLRGKEKIGWKIALCCSAAVLVYVLFEKKVSADSFHKIELWVRPSKTKIKET